MWKFSSIIIAVLLASCAKQQPTTTIQSSTVPRRNFTEKMKENFHGRYKTICHQTEFKGMSVYEVSDESFNSNGRFMRWSRFFSDGNCQIPFAQAKVDGDYQFFNNPGGAEDYGILFMYDFYFVMPESKQIATLMISASFAGLQTWQPQVFTNINFRRTSEATWFSPGDDNLNVMYRTECSSKTPGQCMQIKLVRVNKISDTQENP